MLLLIRTGPLWAAGYRGFPPCFRDKHEASLGFVDPDPASFGKRFAVSGLCVQKRVPGWRREPFSLFRANGTRFLGYNFDLGWRCTPDTAFKTLAPLPAKDAATRLPADHL